MKKLTLILSFILTIVCAFAQNDQQILFSIGNENITKAEFLKAYQKNSSLQGATEKDLRDYLNLYIDYRIKVQEAKHLKLDTAQVFQKEWESYKDQYAQQYLIDSEVSDNLLEETYDRARYHVRTSHILLQLSPNALPKDTLATYHKIMKIRDEIISGMNFNEAAAKYSEDPSARDFINPQTKRLQHGNKGDLGYFSVFEMIYPFETAAYSTPVGSVSMPIRSQFGYHLVYVQDRIPAIAKLYVSQIFISDTNALNGNNKDAVYQQYNKIKERIQRGEQFEALAAEISEDRATKNNGGRMEPCAPSRRPGNFIAAVVNLKNNQISEPVPSSIGWHILRLDSVVYTTVNDEFKYMLKNRLSRDNRSKKSKETLVQRLKSEYNYNESGKKAAMKFLNKNLPENYFQIRNFNVDSIKGIEKLKPMFTFADRKYTVQDFGKYFSRFQGAQFDGKMSDFLDKLFQNFTSEKILQYERTQLMTKYPEYREVVNEVYDGLMIYEINSLKVWNAAIQDTIGAKKFYESIKEQFATNDLLHPYKTFDEVRAVVIGLYQDKLEKDWIKELHQKYPIKLNEDVFQSILKK